MAKAIRSPAIAAANWASRASGAADFYKTQVQASAWKQYAGAAGAEANYATGVNAAVAAKSRLAGVNASSDEAWKAGVSAVGSARFAQGVTASKPRMDAAMGKLIPAIDTARKALPTRGVAGSAANITRMTTFVNTLHAAKGTYKSRGVARTG